MYQLTIYKMTTKDRWRWKFSYQQRVLARSDYHYANPSKAETAFDRFRVTAYWKPYRTRVEI